MFELIGFSTALLFVGFMIVLGLLALAAPVAWLWMLIDAILREDSEYPGDYENARLIWVLLLAFLPATALVYFFAVYAKAKRGQVAKAADSGDISQGAQVTAVAPYAEAAVSS